MPIVLTVATKQFVQKPGIALDYLKTENGTARPPARFWRGWIPIRIATKTGSFILQHDGEI